MAQAPRIIAEAERQVGSDLLFVKSEGIRLRVVQHMVADAEIKAVVAEHVDRTRMRARGARCSDEAEAVGSREELTRCANWRPCHVDQLRLPLSLVGLQGASKGSHALDPCSPGEIRKDRAHAGLPFRRPSALRRRRSVREPGSAKVEEVRARRGWDGWNRGDFAQLCSVSCLSVRLVTSSPLCALSKTLQFATRLYTH